MEGMDIPSFEIIEGREKGSKFLVFAKSQTAKLGVRPTVFPGKTKEGMVLHIGFRLRAQVIGEVLSDESIKEFNVPLKRKSNVHASLTGGMQLVALPTISSIASKLMEDQGLVQKMVADIFTRVKSDKVEIILTEEQVVDFLNLEFDGLFPAPPKVEIDHTIRYDF